MRHKQSVRAAALHQFTQYLKMLGANLKMLQLIVLQYRRDMREGKSRETGGRSKLNPTEMKNRTD